MKKILTGGLALLMCAAVLPMAAQDNGATPAPAILQIYREVIKPGRTAAHEKIEAGWPKAYHNNPNSAHYLGMTSITGPSEAWFVSGYASYDAWEKQTKAEASDRALTAETTRLATADGEVVESARSITARFREELSLRPALNIGDYRYINVVTVRVRPGMQDKFIEMRKMIKAAHEKTGMKDYYSIFAVQSGMPTPTFLIFIPMKTLKEADEAGPLHEAPAYKEALGGEAGDKKLSELASASIQNIESMIFSFNPKMSVPPPSYSMGANSDYWNPKQEAAPKAKPVAAKKP